MISNEFIRQATEEYHDETMSAIPSENEIDHVFSDRFEKNMTSVIKKNQHSRLNRALRMAVSFALVILVAGGSVMALSPTARAAVLGWLFGQQENVYSYTSMGNDHSATITKYDFAEVPDGYYLWQDILDPTFGTILYAEEETGFLLKIFYCPNEGSSALFLVPEAATKSTVQLGDITADFYLSEVDTSGSSIVWVDPENDYLVSVDGFFSQEELIEMALRLVKTEVPKHE